MNCVTNFVEFYFIFLSLFKVYI